MTYIVSSGTLNPTILLYYTVDVVPSLISANLTAFEVLLFDGLCFHQVELLEFLKL